MSGAILRGTVAGITFFLYMDPQSPGDDWTELMYAATSCQREVGKSSLEKCSMEVRIQQRA
eukprot:1147869-Amphidinium_carterae.2